MSKHLVLDDDVHGELLKRKAATGLNVKDIGNAILRSLLGQPQIPQLLRRKLIESGLITQSKFDEALREAAAEAAAYVPTAADLIRVTKRDTFTTGSWELKELMLDREIGIQVFKVWTKDSRSRPFPAHLHSGTETLIVLAGRVGVTSDNDLHVIEAPDSFTIPSNTSHAVAPLDRDTVLLVTISPPDDGLSL